MDVLKEILKVYKNDGHDDSWIREIIGINHNPGYIIELILLSKGREINIIEGREGIFDKQEVEYLGEENPDFDIDKYMKILIETNEEE